MKNTLCKLLFLFAIGILCNQIAYVFAYFFIDKMDCLVNMGTVNNESVNALITAIESSINLVSGNSCELIDSAFFWVVHKSISLFVFTVAFLGIISTLLELLSDFIFYPIKGTRLETAIKSIGNLVLKIPYLKTITYIVFASLIVFLLPFHQVMFDVHELVNRIPFISDLSF